MNAKEMNEKLLEIFTDEALFGFCSSGNDFMDKYDFKTALVTLMPYPKLNYEYSSAEFFIMLEDLRQVHSKKMNEIKIYLEKNNIRYASPPASPKDDGNHLAEFSYKWAAIHAGLGFIGKNDVFVHYKYAQKIRISCLLIDFDTPAHKGDINSKCGKCRLCVDACPHGFISGNGWRPNIYRNELVDYKKCANMSKHSGDGLKYLCAHCSLACTYPDIPV